MVSSRHLMGLCVVSLLCPSRGGLCEDHAEVCQLREGTYGDHDGASRQWQAFVPIGARACPPEGCPLYFWVDGTGQYHYRAQGQLFMIEMLERGFIAVTVEYDDHALDYARGCYGNWLDPRGFNDKSREIFGQNITDSVAKQLCNDVSFPANCKLGIAVHGWSQGAHIAALAGNHNDLVSAALLFGNGNDNLKPFSGDASCMDNENLALPRERRRSIAGDADRFFGVTYSGVLKQQIETSGYDCRRNVTGYEYGDHYNCFSKLPEGCDYGSEDYCDSSHQYFDSYCAACTLTSTDPCPSNTNLQMNACPLEVVDTYIGGGATIEDTAGYYIVSGEEYCRFEGCDPNFGAPHWFFQHTVASSGFMRPDTTWGLPQNLDWLARIARITPFAPTSSSSTISSNDTTAEIKAGSSVSDNVNASVSPRADGSTSVKMTNSVVALIITATVSLVMATSSLRNFS